MASRSDVVRCHAYLAFRFFCRDGLNAKQLLVVRSNNSFSFVRNNKQHFSSLNWAQFKSRQLLFSNAILVHHVESLRSFGHEYSSAAEAENVSSKIPEAFEKDKVSDKSSTNDKKSTEASNKGASESDGYEPLTLKEREDYLHQLEIAFGADDPKVGVMYLRLGQEYDVVGESPTKILVCGERALKILKRRGEDSIDAGMCLHLIASAHSKTGNVNACLSKLNDIFNIAEKRKEDNPPGAGLLKFAAHFLRGDIFSSMGKHEEALASYSDGLKSQEGILPEGDPRMGDSYRQMAEAYTQVLQYTDALSFAKKALVIHQKSHGVGSLAEASDRRLLAVIYKGMDDYEKALEQHKLAREVFIQHNLPDARIADIAIADLQIILKLYNDAVATLQNTLSQMDAESPAKALVHVNLAKAYAWLENVVDAARHCQIALDIFKNSKDSTDKLAVAEGFVELASISERLSEPEQAVTLLKHALAIYEDMPGQQNAVAGAQAQIGMVLYLMRKWEDALPFIEKAVENLQASLGRDHYAVASILNQLGATNMELKRFSVAADLFERAKQIFEKTHGSTHRDTLAICSNLMLVHASMRSFDKALEYQRHVVNKLTESGSDLTLLKEEKDKLTQLLSDARKAGVSC